MPLQPAVSALARQTIKVAYDELDRTITSEDKRDFGNTTLQHVRKAALDIENQLAARQSLRNMRRLMPFFQGLEHYSKVVEVLCNGTPFLPWIWAPITLILRIASEYVEAFEKIIKGYASIAESLKRFEILSTAFLGHQELQQTLAVFYADILEFHKNAYKFVRRSGWRLMFLTSWGRFERQFSHILEDLNQHGSLIDQTANALDIVEARKMREDIRAWREESQMKLNREETEQSAKQFEIVASWLKVSESDQLAIFDSILSEVTEHKGSCGWIVYNSKVSSWFQQNPDTPALWLKGSAGTGKSVLCTQLINFMKASDMFVVQHFCSYIYASSTAYEQILKSLILQLVRNNGDLVAHIYEAYVLERKSPTTTALEKLFETLLTNISSSPNQAQYVWIIIDGLDECEPDTQTRLIRRINQVTTEPSSSNVTVCKVLISSRAQSNALRSLRWMQTVSLADEKNALHGAIAQYVGQRLRSLDTRLHQLGIRQTEIGEIQDIIVTKANGMFLYARLVVDYLASNIFYTRQELKQSVNQLPKKLADFYHKILAQILDRLDTRSIDRIRCIFGWIAFAKRPLRKFELLSALAFSPGDPGVDRLAPPYILDICGFLLEEREDSALTFIHISVREFLQSSSSSIIVHEQQTLHEHGVAAVTCLLSGLRVFSSDTPQQDRYLRVANGVQGFHVYATEHWTEYLLSHAVGAGGFDTAPPSPLIILACQLAGAVSISSPETTTENSLEVNQTDDRLPLLWQYPTLHKCVSRALEARSLRNLEARILASHASHEPSEHPLISESISNMLESYQEVVRLLPGCHHLEGLSPSELDLFNAQFRTAAFTCRLRSCPRATLGFKMERLRSDHERAHIRYFPCTFPGCQSPPFTSSTALKSHRRDFHTPNTVKRSMHNPIPNRCGNSGQQYHTVLRPALTGNQRLEAAGDAGVSTTYTQQQPCNLTTVAGVPIGGNDGLRLPKRSTPPHLERMPQQQELLDLLGNQDELEESPQPTVIKGSLGRHQKQALTFMLRREQGWAFSGQRPDVWKMVDSHQGQFFLNRVSNNYQSQQPPQCYGGIIADPMGLGKTLTMIALIASDLGRNTTSTDVENDGLLNVPATLIIVPPPLIGTWEEQLRVHVYHGGITWHRHHRETRLRSTNGLDRLNIVLTTYHTVSAEWNSGNSARDPILFSIRWGRIILDEAHVIRNASSKMSQAVCALDSKSRWAVTGTPIQNRLGDLATLFKFIRAHPYTDRQCFDADISHLWKSGAYDEAVKRLQRLSACLLLRRPKSIINLLARRDMQCPVNLSAEERALYDRLRQKAVRSIDEAINRDARHPQTGIYANVLQQIESLRLVCNLGLHYQTRHNNTLRASPEDSSWASTAQGTFNVQRDMEPPVCSQCGSTLGVTETLLEESFVPQEGAQFSRCLKFVCADCTQMIVQAGGAVECGHNPPCSMATVSTNNSALESSLYEVQQQMRVNSITLSSKVEALIADIKTLPLNEKCIVFSTWRLTLDMVEAGLERAFVPSVRFDGKVPQNERQGIVERFRTDPSIRVMLLTLSCGAAGLTLTVATRAYLMEPHWNPTLEEQALARIHRIGQTQEVTTVRFYVRDSFEQHVMEVQESKKQLAGLLLSPHDGEQTGESQRRLEKLRSLI